MCASAVKHLSLVQRCYRETNGLVCEAKRVNKRRPLHTLCTTTSTYMVIQGTCNVSRLLGASTPYHLSISGGHGGTQRGARCLIPWMTKYLELTPGTVY